MMRRGAFHPGWTAAWMVLVLASGGCVDFDEELRRSECVRDPSTCTPQAPEPSPETGTDAGTDTPVADGPPIIEEVHQSATMANPGEDVTLLVKARMPREDPRAVPLVFMWFAPEGALNKQANTPHESQVTWTAPPCWFGGSIHVIVVSVMDGQGRTTDQEFLVTGPPTCAPR